MKSVIALVVCAGVAYADKFPASGPCDDVDACEMACKANKQGTCYWGGVLLLQAMFDEAAEVRALALFDRACANNDADACWQRARIVRTQEFRAKGDGSKARAAFQKACTKNHARACMRLGDIAGAASDAKSKKLSATSYAKAIKLLDARCTAKMAQACSWLADIYDNGYAGAKHDAKKADAYDNKKCLIQTGNKCPPRTN